MRKHSRTIQKGGGGGDKKPQNFVRLETATPITADTNKSGEELSNLRELLKLRDNEIVRLKREIHKLKVSSGHTTETDRGSGVMIIILPFGSITERPTTNDQQRRSAN